MPLTLEELVKAGFPEENFPTDLPKPGPENITMATLDDNKELYRYGLEKDGQQFAMEIVINRTFIDSPGEGVGFMLNQFAYLWRMDQPKLVVQAGGACRRIEF